MDFIAAASHRTIPTKPIRVFIGAPIYRRIPELQEKKRILSKKGPARAATFAKQLNLLLR
jgi:hypothetical protein